MQPTVRELIEKFEGRAPSLEKIETADSVITVDELLRRPNMTIEEMFFQAVKEGKREQVIELLSKGVYINAVDKNNHTALYHAFTKGDAQIAEVLLYLGANPDIRYEGKNLIEILASPSGSNLDEDNRIKLIQHLYIFGADVYKKSPLPPENPSDKIKKLFNSFLNNTEVKSKATSYFNGYIKPVITENLKESFFNGHWDRVQLRDDDKHSLLRIEAFKAMESGRLDDPNLNMTPDERYMFKLIPLLPNNQLIVERVNELIANRNRPLHSLGLDADPVFPGRAQEHRDLFLTLRVPPQEGVTSLDENPICPSRARELEELLSALNPDPSFRREGEQELPSALNPDPSFRREGGAPKSRREGEQELPSALNPDPSSRREGGAPSPDSPPKEGSPRTESSENPSANVVTRSGAKTVSDDGKGPARQ